MSLTHARKRTEGTWNLSCAFFSQTSPVFSMGGVYWEECYWKGNTNGRSKGLSRWQRKQEISAPSMQILGILIATLLIYEVNKATAGDGWGSRGLSDDEAPTTLFNTSLKQFQNQFQIWQAVRTLLLLNAGSDTLRAIRRLRTHVGARSAYSLLEEPEVRYYNHLTWGHGHMLCDPCLCHSPLSQIPSIVHRD